MNFSNLEHNYVVGVYLDQFLVSGVVEFDCCDSTSRQILIRLNDPIVVGRKQVDYVVLSDNEIIVCLAAENTNAPISQ